MRFKRILLGLLRFILGIGLLLFLFWKADINKIVLIIRQTSPEYIVLAILLFLLAVATISLRWKLLLAAHSINIPFYRTFAYYLIGFFFNNFLPTGVGLDIVRAVYASNSYGKKPECFASVISERIIGFLALLSISVIFLPIFIMKNRFILFIFFGLLALTITIISGIFLFLKRNILGKFTWLFKIKMLLTLKDKIKKLYNALYYYKEKKSVVIHTLFLSFLFQVTLITMAFFIGKALTLKIPYYFFLSFIPVINIASMVPITINGIGVREGLYVYLFSLAGIEPSQSILISIIYVVVTMFVSLIGAVIFMLGIKKRRKL